MSTTKPVHFTLLLCGLMLHVFSHTSAQIDTTEFPLNVGNKWYYRYVNRLNPSPMVLVKTITDTMADGTRMVRTTRLGEDSVILATETWKVSRMGFYQNTILLYHSFLTHDSSLELGLHELFQQGDNPATTNKSLWYRLQNPNPITQWRELRWTGIMDRTSSCFRNRSVL